MLKAIKPAEFERVIVDSTVQEKAIAYPTDSRLLEVDLTGGFTATFVSTPAYAGSGGSAGLISIIL